MYKSNNNRHSAKPPPLVSIITVCFNSELYLEQTIQSVLGQTYEHIEYIVIDGGSTDNTINIIKKYEARISKWLSEPDENMYDAINKGMALVTGDYWAVLNSDDTYLTDTVQTVADFFNRHPDIKVFTGAERMIDENNKYIYTRYPPKFSVNSMIRLRTNGIISHPATFLSREVMRTVGKFNCAYQVIADYDFLIRVGLRYHIAHSRRPLLNFRLHSGQLSMDYSQVAAREKDRQAIVSYYSRKNCVNMNLVWWDWIRINLANPHYFCQRQLTKIRRLLGGRIDAGKSSCL